MNNGFGSIGINSTINFNINLTKKRQNGEATLWATSRDIEAVYWLLK
jgi:hypothetical protein